jgi:hypothetical protein
MKAYISLWQRLAEFLLEWNVSDKVVEEKKKKQTFYCQQIFFPRKSCLLWDNVEKCVESDMPQMTMRDMTLCVLGN